MQLAQKRFTSPDFSPDFAHSSERHFAALLDFYRIQWEYEPRSFILDLDEHGTPTRMVTPDFYLPDFDLYIEITTLNQKLVTKKNRKIRRLREMYPDVRCKILYEKDYLYLFHKYGLDEYDPTELERSSARD